MAGYAWDFTIPANIAKGKSRTLTLPLTQGIIVKADFLFPRGCKGLVGCRLMDNRMPVYPANVGEWLISDDETITFPDYYKLLPPYKLTIHGYNLDEVKQHNVYVRLTILPEEIALRRL